MAADRIKLNNVTFGKTGLQGPTNVEPDLLVFGSEQETRNGALSLLETGKKWHWTITWDAVDVATRNAVRSIALLSSTFTFVDEDGVSHTVQCPKEGRYKAGISITGSDGGGTLYYGVTLVIREA